MRAHCARVTLALTVEEYAIVDSQKEDLNTGCKGRRYLYFSPPLLEEVPMVLLRIMNVCTRIHVLRVLCRHTATIESGQSLLIDLLFLPALRDIDQ